MDEENIVQQDEMEIEDEIELMDDLEREDEDFDHILSDDSCFESDSDETFDKKYQDFKQAEVNTFDELKKMCVIYFYFVEKDYIIHKYCSECIVRMHAEFEGLRAVRKHMIRKYTYIRGKYCAECKKPLFQIMPRNLCYICTN